MEITVAIGFAWMLILGIAAFGGRGGGSWQAHPRTIKWFGEMVKYAGGKPSIVYEAYKYAPKSEQELKDIIDKLRKSP